MRVTAIWCWGLAETFPVPREAPVGAADPPALLSLQGVPLDTSKLPADQRLPPYPYSQPGLLLQSQPSPKSLPQPVQHPPQPPLPPAPPARPPVPPSVATQRPYGPPYQPNAAMQPQLGQSLGDFSLGSVSAPGGER